MQLPAQFTRFINNNHLFSKKDKLLLAISGGVDSIVLANLCELQGYDFQMAHCNFLLRGAESEDDAAFVKSLAEGMGVGYFEKRFPTGQFAADNKLSIQVAARKLRYKWFDEIMETNGFDYLLTAHHADDNIETVMMNFFRGTGISGIRGMNPRKGNIARPLLFAWKEDLIKYAADNNLAFREDSSNAEEKYTRNYFRNVIIPGIEKVFPKVKANLLENAVRFSEIERFYDHSIAQNILKLVEYKGSDIHIPVLKLAGMPGYRTILFEIIKRLNFSAAQVDEVLSLTSAETGKYVLSPTHRVLRNRKWLIISPLAQPALNYHVIEENTSVVKFGSGTFSISYGHQNFKDEGENVFYADKSQVKFPMILRKWKQGDYFYPIGLKKPSGSPARKKVSRYLADRKLSIADKERQWVLETGGRIAWVVGLRQDERFKVKPSSKEIIRIAISLKD